MASSDQTRLLIVEDVPQVAQYIRGLLNAQDQVKLLDVVTDGRHVVDQVRELRPDVLMIDALLQGLGRLIRHRSDRGILAVLDPRLRTMGYGRRFLASLPPAPITHDLEAVRRFFEA